MSWPSTLSGAGLYVFLTGWPHVVIDIFHVPPQYFGFTFLLNGIGLIVVFARSPRSCCITVRRRTFCSAALVAQAGVGGAGAAVQLDWAGAGCSACCPGSFVYCSLIGGDQSHRPRAWP